jgi:hypothetical protein
MPQDVVLGLAEDIERPTLELLERRSGSTIDFEILEACLRAHSPDACGRGEIGELKGRTTVFVDSRSSHAFMQTENAKRIAATIEGAGLSLKVVSRADDAEVILVFRYFGGAQPTCTEGIGYGPDRGSAEVYVARATGPRVVMVFDEECRIWRRWLAETFGRAFIRAYKSANAGK